jgi:predicted transcriptional regulator
MSKATTRRLVAALLALLVICSFAGAPAIVAAGSGDSLGDGVSSVGSDDGDSSENSTDEGSDDSTDGADDSDEESGNSADGTDDSDEESGDSTDGTDVNFTGEIDGTTETVDDTGKSADDATGVAAYGTIDITEPTRTTSGDGIGLPYDGEDGNASGGEATGSEERLSPHEFRVDSDSRMADAGDDNGIAVIASSPPTGSTAALSTGAGGDGGQPVPAGGSGGVALGLGAVAAAAVVRSTSLVATSTSSSTGTAVSGYLSSLLDRVKPFVFPLRYSRYDDSDPLAHDAREQVYEIVSETPGSYLSEVSEQADLPLSTTRHHMKILEREDLVSGAKLRGKRRFYPAYAEGIELSAALNDDSTASIIDALARLGAASVSDLADELGRDPSTISHHLQRLEADSIIAREREGRAVMNKLSPEARTALEPETTPRPDEASEALAD